MQHILKSWLRTRGSGYIALEKCQIRSNIQTWVSVDDACCIFCLLRFGGCHITVAVRKFRQVLNNETESGSFMSNIHVDECISFVTTKVKREFELGIEKREQKPAIL